MKIVADKGIYQVEEYFSPYGELVLLPGREITPDTLKDADALLVRTVTRVDEILVGNSGLKFVGSASSGVDHVDCDFLGREGLHFSYAPGCNAGAVVDYVFAVLAFLAERKSIDWRGLSMGIIGAGNVGSRLAAMLDRLGVDFLVHDPFLGDDFGHADRLAPFAEAVKQNVVTIHTSLSHTGSHPTFHLLDQPVLESLGDDTILINAARGPVVDNLALDRVLAGRNDLDVVLDVWEGEPNVHLSLLQKVALGTPHIAGYSIDGKINATEMVFNDFCGFFARPKNERPAGGGETISLGEVPSGSETDIINHCILQAYPVTRDALPLTGLADGAGYSRLFEERRNSYRFRPEFSHFQIDGESLPEKAASDLAILGFRI